MFFVANSNACIFVQSMYNADKMILKKLMDLFSEILVTRQKFTDSQEVHLTLNCSMVGQINRSMQNQRQTTNGANQAFPIFQPTTCNFLAS